VRVTAGGPGCSSEIAILYENGPYSLAHNLTLLDNKYGWDVNSNMIFVDQPINTGFSWSDVSRGANNNSSSRSTTSSIIIGRGGGS
jgi:carboxypeptidase C (cathepsin A)